MARDFSREPYRKLLLRPSTGFLSLDVLTQGLAYVLFRVADDDGFIAFDNDFAKGCLRVCKMIGGAPRERRLIAERLRELVTEGTFEHRGARLYAPRLEEINRRRDRSSTKPPPPPSDVSEPAPSVRDPSVERAPSERRVSVERSSNDPRVNVERASNSLERASNDHHTTIDDGVTTENHSTDMRHPSRARARSQVGREVGREGGREDAREDAPSPAPVEVLSETVSRPIPIALSEHAQRVRSEILRRAIDIVTPADEGPLRRYAQTIAMAFEAEPRASGGDAVPYIGEMITYANKKREDTSVRTAGKFLSLVAEKAHFITADMVTGRRERAGASTNGSRAKPLAPGQIDPIEYDEQRKRERASEERERKRIADEEARSMEAWQAEQRASAGAKK